MSVEEYKILLEAQSIDLKIASHLKNIENEENRLKMVDIQIEQRQELSRRLGHQLNQLKAETADIEKELYDTEKKLESSKEHMSLITCEKQLSALENEISSLEPKSETLQEKALENMEDIESTEEMLKECDEFLNGVEKTRQEIQDEVSKKSDEENKQIKNYEERIQFILKECNPELRNCYLISNKKYRFNNPLAFSEGGSCSHCRFTLVSKDRSDLETGNHMINCLGCGRLLTPQAARNA